MTKLQIQTHKKQEVLDITEATAKQLADTTHRHGLLHLFVLHTTTALTIADLDPGTDQDLLDAFQELVPKLKYRHPHNPEHAPDHILSSLIGTSLAIPVERGRPVLGTWQRIVLLEFDGPQTREIALTIVPSA